MPATADGKLHRCSARDIVRLTDDGTLGQYENNFFRDEWTDVAIHTAIGALRRRNGSLEQWAVLQRGFGVNDFVASPHANLVSASTDLIPVRAWNDEPKVTFLYFGLSMLIAGVCEPIL